MFCNLKRPINQYPFLFEIVFSFRNGKCTSILFNALVIEEVLCKQYTISLELFQTQNKIIRRPTSHPIYRPKCELFCALESANAHLLPSSGTSDKKCPTQRAFSHKKGLQKNNSKQRLSTNGHTDRVLKKGKRKSFHFSGKKVSPSRLRRKHKCV